MPLEASGVSVSKAALLLTRLGAGRDARVRELLWLTVALAREGGEFPSLSMERLPVRADLANDLVRRGDNPEDVDADEADGRVRRLEVSADTDAAAADKSRELDRWRCDAASLEEDRRVREGEASPFCCCGSLDLVRRRFMDCELLVVFAGSSLKSTSIAFDRRLWICLTGLVGGLDLVDDFRTGALLVLVALLTSTSLEGRRKVAGDSRSDPIACEISKSSLSQLLVES